MSRRSPTSTIWRRQGFAGPERPRGHSGGKLRSLSFPMLLRPFSNVPPVRSTSCASFLIIGSMPSIMPVSRLPKYSPLCCLYSSRKVFCTATVSVGREREHASAYFSVSASSLSRGTTLLMKPQSYISFALKGRPVKSISENLRSPIVSAHHHSRGPQPP